MLVFIFQHFISIFLFFFFLGGGAKFGVKFSFFQPFFLLIYLFTIQTLTLLVLLTMPYHSYITNNYEY